MAYHHKIRAAEIRANLKRRIDQDAAELKALQAVKINTKHKTLTNRAIEGPGARVGDYIGTEKALYIYYTVKYEGGGVESRSSNVTAYTYEDEAGEPLGVDGIIKRSRTLTPRELGEKVGRIIKGKREAIREFKKEYSRADATAKKQNALIDRIDAYNARTSYATKAQI